jgi:hypothetical protein
MRVEWVHPSWRDLVIDHLSSDHDARERFLHNCSVHGALLALSLAGGHGGERELPLLKHDTDWDALTDRLYTLVPELERAELLGLMDALALTIHDLSATPTAPEANALATAVLARLTTVWRTAREPIALPALEAWSTLAGGLSSKPEPPAISVTWAELLPTAAPQPTDGANLERFADWLTLGRTAHGLRPWTPCQTRLPWSHRAILHILEALEPDRPRYRTRRHRSCRAGSQPNPPGDPRSRRPRRQHPVQAHKQRVPLKHVLPQRTPTRTRPPDRESRRTTRPGGPLAPRPAGELSAPR